MTTIHVIGSEGFIGKAIQREAIDHSLHLWSHRHSDQDHYFDLLDRSSWQSITSLRPSHVIFLSWPGLPNYQENFHITRNLPACIEFFEKLYDVGLRRIVVAGTCYEYGLQNGALKEEYPTNPVNCYAIAKDCLRRTIENYFAQQGLQWCWARIFYPYGIGQNPNSFLPSLDRAIYEGESEFAMSSGRQVRDFVSVETVAKVLLKLAVNAQAQGVYNCGSSIPISLRELAEDRIAKLNSSISLNLGLYPERHDEPLAFWADMSKVMNFFPDLHI